MMKLTATEAHKEELTNEARQALQDAAGKLIVALNRLRAAGKLTDEARECIAEARVMIDTTNNTF